MRQRLLFKGVAAFLLTFLVSGVFAQESEETVTTPTIKTLTSDDDTSFDYEGNVAVLITAGSTAEATSNVSGLIYKWSTEKAYTKDDFASHSVPSATTVTMPSTIVTLEDRTVDYYLTAIAYKTGSDGTRIYSDVVSCKYTYTATEKFDLTLSVDNSPVTIDMTQENVTTGTANISAKNGETSVTGLSYSAYCSNEQIATASVADALLTITGKNKYGVATVMIITKGNETYKPAFVKTNAVVKTSIPAMEDNTIYSSIADFRAAGEQKTRQTGILKFTAENPATVVARFVNDDSDMKGGKNNIFIVDKSGYGLMVYYETNKGAKFIDDNKLYAGSVFTGTIIGQYKQRTSNIPEISEMQLNTSITGSDEETYTTQITVDHSGESTNTIDASVPVTEVANIYTINTSSGNSDAGSKPSSSASYGPYLNTVVTLPGIIKQRSGEYILVQDENNESNEAYYIYLNAGQIDGVNLENYLNLSGVFKGLITKRDNTSTKLTILSSNFFTAEEMKELKISEEDDEDYIKNLYETGALEATVKVSMKRTNWTKDTWGTICLPFELNASEFENIYGTEFTLAKVKTENETGKVENGILQFEELTGGEINIEAGVPYLIKVTDNTTGNIKSTDFVEIGEKKIIAPEPGKIKAYFDDSNENAIVNGEFYFCGLYGKKNKDDEGNGIAGNQKYQYISTNPGQNLYYLPEGSTLSFAGLRAYLYFPNWDSEKNNTLAGNNTTSASQSHALVIGIGNGTTSIKGVSVQKDTDEKVFNLAGQYVGNSTTTGLTKGIYIRDGKKFVVK